MVYDLTLLLLGCGCTVQRGIVNAAVRNRSAFLHENMPDAMCQQLGIAAVHNRRIDLRIADFLRESGWALLPRSALRSIASR